MQTLCVWVNRHNAEGLSELCDLLCTGRPSKLTETQQQAVVGWVIEGTKDGEPDWTLESLQLKIKKEFGISFSLEDIRRLLIRYRLRYLTSRPHHSKTDFEAQQQFRDAFSVSASKILPKGFAGTGMDIFSGRVEGWTTLTVESHLGHEEFRPPMVQDQRYGNFYLFTSICPGTGCLVYHVCGNANTEQMNLHLQQISATLLKGVHELIVLDKASW